MPKKIPLNVARDWLRMHQEGKSESQIGKETRHDLRTVKGAIEALQAEEDLRLIRTQAYRQSFDGHMARLLGDLRTFARRASSSLPQRPMVSVYPLSPSPDRVCGLQVGRTQSGVLYAERPDTTGWKLLAQHLRGDSLLRNIERMETALLRTLEGEAELAEKVVRELAQATSLSVTDDGDIDRVPLPGADAVFSQTWSEAVSGRSALKSMKSSLRPDEQGNGLWHSGRAVIWSGSKVNSGVRDRLIALLDAAGKWEELKEVRRTRSEFEELSRAASEQASIVVHGGFLAGTCDACKRFRL